MSRILLVHGWGFDADFWAPLARALEGHACVPLDLGHLGAARLDPPADLDLVVGHSFGCLWAMAHPALARLPLLAVNGFPRFSASGDFPFGTPPRVIDLMLRRLEARPDEVLAAFRARCGAPPAALPSEPGLRAACLEALRRDLRRLRDEDAREAPAPRLALAAPDDPLLPLALSRQAFPDALRVLPDGGHLLPWTRTAQVAGAVLELLARG